MSAISALTSPSLATTQYDPKQHEVSDQVRINPNPRPGSGRLEVNWYYSLVGTKYSALLTPATPAVSTE